MIIEPNIMSHQTHPLIEAITQPLADNAEMSLSAVQILEQTFDPDHPSIPQMLERLEARDKKRFPWLGKIAIWILAVTALGFGIHAERSMIWTVINYRGFYGFDSPKPPALPRDLTKQERLLLGDPELDEFTQKQLLFESDPANPAYFAEYVGSFKSKHGKMPDGYLETAKRIDPLNSYFPYWAAGVMGNDAVEKKPVKHGKHSGGGTIPPPRYVNGVKLKPLPVEQEYVIKDQAAYDEALRLIRQAGELPNFDHYEILMMKARMRLVSGNDTVPGFMRALMVQYAAPSYGLMSLMKVSQIMSARAEELSKGGQREEFLLLAAQRDALASRLSRSSLGTLVHELVFFAMASSTATNFQAAAERLELPELAETYRKQNDRFVEERDRRELNRNSKSEDLIQKHGASLSRLALPMIEHQVKSPPSLTDDDLKPLRMAEHEVLGRLGILCAALILPIAALFLFLFRFLVSLPIRNTAKRFACLLKTSDWIWIVTLGIIPSILFFIYISRFSPVSGRNVGSFYFLFIFPGLHLSVLLLNLLLAPAVVTRWRLKRRAAAFKFGSPLDLLSLPVFVVMFIYSFAAYPVLVKFNLILPVQIALAAPLAGWVGFVFFNGLRIFLGSARSRLIQTATSMAVIPAYPLAIIALCLVLPMYHAGEKYWLPKDKLHLVDPDAPDLGAYEFKIAALKRKEINAILGID